MISIIKRWIQDACSLRIMKIDLHIHSNCSDGKMNLEDIFEEARRRHVDMLSITDHDSIDCQVSAKELADAFGIRYIYGLELSVSFSHPDYRKGKPIHTMFCPMQHQIIPVIQSHKRGTGPKRSRFAVHQSDMQIKPRDNRSNRSQGK